MTVSAVSSHGHIQNIYTYHNTHFNQVQAVPVTPVRKAGKIAGISQEEDRIRFAAVYKSERDSRTEPAVVAKQTERLKNSFDAGQEFQYNISNPYEASRMSMDGMLLAGINIDVMA